MQSAKWSGECTGGDVTEELHGQLNAVPHVRRGSHQSLVSPGPPAGLGCKSFFFLSPRKQELPHTLNSKRPVAAFSEHEHVSLEGLICGVIIQFFFVLFFCSSDQKLAAVRVQIISDHIDPQFLNPPSAVE